jgi:hypothetical protein
MSCQRRSSILSLTLFLLGMGATVACRAEETAAPRAAPELHNNLLLCTVDFSSCVSAIKSSQKTSRYPGRQGSIKTHPSQHASDWRDTNTRWQSSDRPVNFSAADKRADTDGRLALKVTLDKYYHGALYNLQAPFEPMQVSLNYIRAW